MAKRISKAQKTLAKELRLAGNSWPIVAKKTGVYERSLQYLAKNENWPAKFAVPAKNTANRLDICDADIDGLAELVRNRLAKDIESSVIALESMPPAELELNQLEKREKVADSVQKRAASLFNIGETEKPVVNIAVLSQLPENVNC